MHSNQYIFKMNMCQTLRIVIRREILIVNEYETQAGVNMKSVKSVSLSERLCICWLDLFVLEGKLEVEDVDCVTEHMDFDVTYLNPSIWQPLCDIPLIQRSSVLR